MKNQIADLIANALENIQQEQQLDFTIPTPITVQRYKQPEHGDSATNIG